MISNDLVWCIVHNNSKARWGSVVWFIVKARQYSDYYAGLPHKASWHAYITFAHLMILAGNGSLEAVV